MNKIINRYLIFNFSKVLLNTILIFFALGVVLNLFEELEFFKNLNQSIVLPLILSASFVPTLILELLPFIVFLSAVFYFLALKTNKDLLSIKIFGYSNIKIILILSLFAFLFGSLILVTINPITSSLIKYYEIEKSKYATDVNHLISINKNGLWVKENSPTGYKIINADLERNKLENISVYVFNSNGKILKRIEAETANIDNNPWLMKNVIIYNLDNNKETINLKSYEFETSNTLVKINSLYSNLNTISFIDLIANYTKLKDKGYTEKLLDEKINKFISLPFFLFLMVILASIFTIGSIDKKQNYYYVVVSILICVIIYYFKDLSIALGQTGKIGLVMSVWMPIILISLCCSIGVIQINEK